VSQRNAELRQVLLSQVRQNFPIKVILAKQIGILSQSNLFQPKLQIGHLGTQPERLLRRRQICLRDRATLRKQRHSAREYFDPQQRNVVVGMWAAIVT
jgi:hypothetical protein